ncbi:MAG TPA: RNA methyltransferase [Anaerolineales bacterium]|nr:RNA methyltransferase [Anaerolineales bacterium]
MTLLTSRQNPKIKQIRSLHKRKQRETQGVFIVEGIRHVGEAVEAGASIEYILYAPDLLTSEYAYNLLTHVKLTNTPVFTTTPDIFSYVADKDNPQGILAVVQHNLKPLAALNTENLSWGVAIFSPQDPGNLGTILRTLDSAGAYGLIVINQGTDIFHPTAVRASMGTLFWKTVAYTNQQEFAEWVQEQHYHIYGTSAHGREDYAAIQYQRPALLLLGSEREGLTEEQVDLCNTLIRLPMRGRATSLNLSIAAGIMLYEMGKQLVE